MSIPDIRVATETDIDTLLPLMREYYRDDALPFGAAKARVAMLRLLSQPQWGAVMLAEIEGVAVGYAALCIGFSLELGGNDAFVDELYVEPAYRGRGIAQRLMHALEQCAQQQGVCALHLEVDKGNAAAKRMYSARGYLPRDRYHLMTKNLVG